MKPIISDPKIREEFVDRFDEIKVESVERINKSKIDLIRAIDTDIVNPLMRIRS